MVDLRRKMPATEKNREVLSLEIEEARLRWKLQKNPTGYEMAFDPKQCRETATLSCDRSMRSSYKWVGLGSIWTCFRTRQITVSGPRLVAPTPEFVGIFFLFG